MYVQITCNFGTYTHNQKECDIRLNVFFSNIMSLYVPEDEDLEFRVQVMKVYEHISAQHLTDCWNFFKSIDFTISAFRHTGNENALKTTRT